MWQKTIKYYNFWKKKKLLINTYVVVERLAIFIKHFLSAYTSTLLMEWWWMVKRPRWATASILPQLINFVFIIANSNLFNIFSLTIASNWTNEHWTYSGAVSSGHLALIYLFFFFLLFWSAFAGRCELRQKKHEENENIA